MTKDERDDLVKLLGPLSLIAFNANPSWLDGQLVAMDWVSGFGCITFGDCRRAATKVKELLAMQFEDQKQESTMTWEQKLSALKALTATHLEMRAPGDWYVSAYGREEIQGKFLVSRSGNGSTPETAVNNDWDQMTAAERIRVPRGEFRWGGWMLLPLK